MIFGIRQFQIKPKGKEHGSILMNSILLTQTESSAKFLQVIFKRARKWGGIPTGITQNVEDMLATKNLVYNFNSDFVMMLNQHLLTEQNLLLC